MVLEAVLSSPYASAAAVGSFTRRRTSRPAMRPASFVACRCASLKYAGTVMTALVTAAPKYRSALRRSCCSTSAEISGGVNGVPRRVAQRAAGGVADQDRLALNCHDRRNEVDAIFTGNDGRNAVLHKRYEGVRGAEVDAYDA